jgi:hypothetical protein
VRATLKAVALFLCSVGTLLNAQEFRATVAGYVVDASGARIPQAKVEVTNLATKEVANATTDNSGSYTIPLLRPGTYKMTVTAAGFKQFVRDQLTLQIGQAAGVDATLQLGDITQTVEVTGESAMLETETANRVGLLDEKSVAELPLNSGRNPFMLGLTASGVTFRGASIWQRPFDNGAIAQWVVNGSWQSNNEFLLDGAPNNAQMGGNNIAYVPIVETVQEFTMMQNTYDPEFGHSMGGILNTVMKSGGSSFHGTGWEFLRRTFLDAANFQVNAVTPPGGGKAVRTEHYLDDYGGQVSGQVIIPKLLKRDGNIKLFYMGAFQNYREGTPDPVLVSYPMPEMRNGDFSKLQTGSGVRIPIYDPLTAAYDASGNILVNRQVFPGNIIPASRIDPVARAVTKYMPMPNTVTPNTTYSSADFTLGGQFDADKYYNMTMRFDWNLGSRNRVFVSEASNDRTENRPTNGIVGVAENGQQPFQRINDRYVVDWTSTVTPTTVFDIRIANNRFIEKGFGAANAGFDLTSLGLPKSLTAQLPQPQYFGLWQESGYTDLGRYASVNITNYYGLEANVTKIVKNHSLKAGVDLRRNQYLVDDTGNILQIGSGTTFTRFNGPAGGNDPATGLAGGDGYASFLLGYPDSGSSNYPAYPFYRQWYAGMYVKDDWKVNSRLTLNLGIRYDINAPPDEKYNRLNGAFDPNAASPLGQMVSANIAKGLSSAIPAQFASLYSNLSNLKGSMTFAGVNGTPTKAAKIDWSAIQPRIGFAYRIKDRLVARGGYGMYVPNTTNDWLISNGFSTSTTMVTSNDGNRTPIGGVLENPYPNGINTPPGSKLGPLTFAGKGFNWTQPDVRLARSHQFSFGLQYQTTKTSTLEASYVGNRVSHTQSNYPWDLVPSSFYNSCSVMYGASTPAGFASPAAYCQQSVPNPFQGLTPFIGTTMYTASTISLYQLMRPYPQFTGGTEYGLSQGHVWYNSLQVNFNQRVAKGLTLLANYTLSKQNEKWGYLNYYQNPIQYQEGLYYADRPHFIKFTAVYELPFGQGQKFLAGTTGLAKRLVSGWELNTFITDSPKGEPANMPNGVIPLKNPALPEVHWGANTVHIWNNCVLNQADNGVVTPTATSVSQGCSPTDFSNYDWLILAPSFRPNQTNSYRSPNIRVQGTYTADASVAKMTQITERVKFQFRAEAFNVLNHWNYMLTNIDTGATSVTFGAITPHTTGTTGSVNPRSIQLGFKVLW